MVLGRVGIALEGWRRGSLSDLRLRGPLKNGRKRSARAPEIREGLLYSLESTVDVLCFGGRLWMFDPATISSLPIYPV